MSSIIGDSFLSYLLYSAPALGALGVVIGFFTHRWWNKRAKK